jgi:exopolysaccharide production protein ExoQ
MKTPHASLPIGVQRNKLVKRGEIGLFSARRNGARKTHLSTPSRFAWVVAVFVLIVQQAAFTGIAWEPIARNESQNPFNTVCIALSLILIIIACYFSYRSIIYLATINTSTILYVALIFISLSWSVHPDITLRRGVGYVLSILVAAYIVTRFTEKDRMKVITSAFAIAALGSLLFVVIFPDYGIMSTRKLAGAWRGVFAHKNSLGSAMSTAVFAVLYLIALDRIRMWRVVWLVIFSVLVIMSRSITALLVTMIYIPGTLVYLFWRKDRLVGAIVATLAALLVILVQLAIWDDASLVLNFLGKDLTMTGRTDLWLATIDLIKQKPLLGWGFMATWNPTDPEFAAIQDQFDWISPGAHNGLLDITLQLGLVGAGILLAIILIGASRSIRCCKRGILPLGWFSLMFVASTFLSNAMEGTMGQTQNIDWVIFNVLIFSCGSILASQSKRVRRSSGAWEHGRIDLDRLHPAAVTRIATR